MNTQEAHNAGIELAFKHADAASSLEQKHKDVMDAVRLREKKRAQRARQAKPRHTPRPRHTPKPRSFPKPSRLPKWALPAAAAGALGLAGLLTYLSERTTIDPGKWKPTT